MTQKSWMAWIWLALVFLWTPSMSEMNAPWYYPGHPECQIENPLKYLKKINIFVADTFISFVNDTIRTSDSPKGSTILFLQRNSTFNSSCNERWPQMGTKNGSYFLYVSEWYVKKDKKHPLLVLHGKNCSTVPSKFPDGCNFTSGSNSSCQVRCLSKKSIKCKKTNYDENFCNGQGQNITDRYIINLTATEAKCINCYTPTVTIDSEKALDTSIPDGGEINPETANQIIEEVSELVSSTNDTTIALSAGEGVKGVLIKTNPLDLDKVSFAYTKPTDHLKIIQDPTLLPDFSRSIEVSKEAFEKAVNSNISQPFAAVLRFLNMTKDEQNSTVLGNEVVAVEMGANIRNLTDTINVNFLNMNYEGTPHCNSWNGEGSRPNWTEEGCTTLTKGNNITCECSHLTFFAILLTPPNDTISSSDLNNLTIITQAGCGMSMFFLSVVLFSHFLLRKTKATKATKILINLVLAMFFLNFTFLTNNFVAKTKNAVGCKIMAALMHYFMLTTFTLFAAQAFHICLQLYTGGKIDIHHYILKVSITSWVIPSIIGTVLLSIGKYGEQVIYTDNAEDNVAMCWITDVNIHYFVNIGYYALVFLFTFTTFVITLSWLYCLKRSKDGSVQTKRNSMRIITILGLCCMLGVTWGFAFFAYGVLRIPATYIFTALNSFQGFFLFIYYHYTSQSKEAAQYPVKAGSTESSSTTLNTGLDIFENPYSNLPTRNKI